jgi:iron(III) transport system substrate-binding protein
MIRHASILLLAAAVIALPFALRRGTGAGEEEAPAGALRLVVITPHNEAIRAEFARGFSEWHREIYRQPVKVDWRVIGGTTEIMRYLASEMTLSFRAWWRGRGHDWPSDGASMILDSRFDPASPPPEDPAARAAWETRKAMVEAFRSTDDPAQFGCRIDLFFGGGTYDHGKADAQGLTVPPWGADGPPPGLFEDAEGRVLIPERRGGEVWRTETFFGCALSTFGICYNFDRLRELGFDRPPRAWEDLADPRFARQVGVADPTKSGSIAKAFEMIVHEQIAQRVERAGFAPEDVERIESLLADGTVEVPPPDGYREAVEAGWLDGLRLIQRIGANARYFTDGAGRVPVDVGMGNAAAGLAIDFYGRYQAEISRALDGTPRMDYITPRGGSSVSADPISLLRGAEHRELAVRFMEYVLGPEGQKLWTYRPGAPGGPGKFALRRLPIRREFYPSEDPELDAMSRRHAERAVDDLRDPSVDPYALAERFTYRPRWTARHFSVHRDLIRAMCLDAAEELKSAWRAILDAGGPAARPEAMRLLARMPDRPEPLTWSGAPALHRSTDRMVLLREWTLFFRESYREAEAAARGEGAP